MSRGFQEGDWEFVFPKNGDKYIGHYCAHVSGVVWREGNGTYVTHDGQEYEGKWNDDKLDERENVKITFDNGDKYSGKISKHKYNGPGTYTFKNGGRLSCSFVNNKPAGDVIYIDHRNNVWHGTAEHDRVLLSKEHVFSAELDTERGKGQPKHPLRAIKTTEIVKKKKSQETEIDLKEQERKIFAKSTKTKVDVNFEDSDWNRNYEKFKETHKNILKKISAGGVSSLSSEEKEWYKKYLKTVKTVQNFNKPKDVTTCLLKGYLSTMLVESETCRPTTAFDPTSESERS